MTKAKEAGISNILALRGDPPAGQEEFTKTEGGFAYAVDLVRFIRENFGDFFGIAVAGYPEGHPDSAGKGVTPEQDIQYLKEKLDAGADIVITQLFYDCDLFIDWVKQCRAAGITAPIIPGIMPIHTAAGFKRMTGFCKTKIPDHITQKLAEIENDDEEVKRYGLELGVQMCRTLLDSDVGIGGVHLYTLNLEKTVMAILSGLGLDKDVATRKPAPWVKSALADRAKEDVRPIYWSNRPQSYIKRTAQWDEFPNGRFGDHQSPAWGALDDYHIFKLHAGSEAERKTNWSVELSSTADLCTVFVKHLKGEIGALPWSESSFSKETSTIKDDLIKINTAGFLTINSQPSVNAVPSDDEVHGWGGANGYVYQKAYLEFFCSPESLAKLQEAIKAFPSMGLQAANNAGDSVYVNMGTADDDATAVTWGVFPNKEIQQPTVVSKTAFYIWKEEAFALWTKLWRSVYDDNSQSAHVIDEVSSSWFLVSIVDNDYINGDIYKPFAALL